MKPAFTKSPIVIVIIASVVLSACSSNGNSSNLKLHPLYMETLLGAAIGGVIGYQSEEPGEGAAVGAVVFGVAELLEQMDRDKHKEKQEQEKVNDDQETEEMVIRIRNSNGSITPVTIKKKGHVYIGPKGEQYDRLPTEEQLKPIYGM